MPKKKFTAPSTRPLLLKEDGQEYARVEKMLGGNKLQAYCYDGKLRICNIRGTMRKKVWMEPEDYILIS